MPLSDAEIAKIAAQAAWDATSGWDKFFFIALLTFNIALIVLFGFALLTS